MAPAPAGQPLMIAMDTATELASVALHDGTQVLSESTWLAGREHSTRLLLEVARCLERHSSTPRDLTAITVDRGPGSYTGVRVGLSIAKGMALALDLPLCTADSLDVLAHALNPGEHLVQVVIKAGRGRSITASYANGRRTNQPRIVLDAEIAECAVPGTIVLGELSPAMREAISQRGARPLSPAQGLRRAGLLAELGWLALQNGEPADPDRADAVYLSRS